MPTDTPGAFDFGLLSPVTAGGADAVAPDSAVSDAVVLAALVGAEAALALAWADVGTAPRRPADDVAAALGWDGGTRMCSDAPVDAAALAAASTAGGNPVIPLVAALRGAVPEPARVWVHRGATSQDILDTALMRVARSTVDSVLHTLAGIEAHLAAFAVAHRDQPAAARTLTQHAVPTTVGLRSAAWLRGIHRARGRLAGIETPVQLGGAGGTLAAFVQIGGAEAAAALPAAFAARLGLAAPDAPWHTTRWPVTELGDALVQVVDAAGVIAADVATLGRTEIGELAEARGGGSSAMPHKRNPVESVLIRSAALRAPALAATLHAAAALAVDERPDGAWHAEWPTLRELLRLTLGAAAHAESLVAGLQVNDAAVSANLARTRGLILSERLSHVLGPRIGAARLARLVGEVAAGGDIAALVSALPEASDLDADELLDPAEYTGLAGRLVDDAVDLVCALSDTDAPDTDVPDTDVPDTDLQKELP